MSDEAGGTQAVLAEADALYALPLAAFTPERDARAKALKHDDAALAAVVKALRKPSLAAWVVNLLVRRDGAQVEQVVAVGEALREAAQAMSGEDLRALTRQRRQLTAAVTTRARAAAREEGQKVTEAVAEQVEATLTAAMLDAECGRALRSGLLVTALSATGTGDGNAAEAVALPDALGFVAPAREAADTAPAGGEGGRPGLHVVPDPEADAKALAAARETLEEAQDEVDDATAAHDEVAGSLADLQARAMQLQARLDELHREVAELEGQADEVDEEVAEAEEAAGEARATLDDATRRRDEAAAALARLERM